MIARTGGEDGFALLFVLWVMVLLAVVAVGFSHEVGVQATLARGQYNRERARALADAGVSIALLGLLDHRDDASWPLDGSARKLALDGGTVQLRLQDEAGKLDLNYASAVVLADLLQVVADEDRAASVALADDIERWKRQRLTLWSADGAPAATNEGPFLAVDELRQVPGITRRIYDRLEPFVTVLSRSARIDPTSAPREVLLSLPGADPALIDAYVTRRDRGGTASEDVSGLLGLASYLTVEGTRRYVTIAADASASPAGRFVRYGTVSLVAVGNRPFRFVSWREGEAGKR